MTIDDKPRDEGQYLDEIESIEMHAMGNGCSMVNSTAAESRLTLVAKTADTATHPEAAVKPQRQWMADIGMVFKTSTDWELVPSIAERHSRCIRYEYEHSSYRLGKRLPERLHHAHTCSCLGKPPPSNLQPQQQRLTKVKKIH